MNNVINFAAVNAKIKALEGKMLDKKQYEELLNSKDYFEALKYLKENTSYGEAFENMNLSDIHRGDLEIILKRYYIKIFYKISHFLNGNYKKLLNLLFFEYEIEDLKVILRAKYIQKEGEITKQLITYGSPLCDIDYDSLINETNLEVLSEKLKNIKKFKHIARHISNMNQDNLFGIEIALDFEYFSSMRKFSKCLDKENKKIFEEIYGALRDLLNIQWIYRGKKYYKLNSEELFNYTIYDYYKFKREKIKELCYSKNLNEFYEILQKSVYKDVFLNSKDKEYLIEKEMNSYIKKLLVSFNSSSKLNISGTLSYIQLIYIEIKDIISIVENKRYKYQSEDTIRYITEAL
ncbi:MAG: V-type ATPase subunit [Clostridiaceae bacterium]